MTKRIAKWELFEIAATEYLNLTFGCSALFERQGGSDSSVSDIKTITHNGKTFFIEAKMPSAQSGQFVALPDEVSRSFQHSESGTAKINKYSATILEFMNNNFDKFKDPGTSGVKINFDGAEEIFARWIMDSYHSKDVQYFITSNNTILPIEDFLKAFKVTATYRIKQSGPRHVGKGNMQTVVDYLDENFGMAPYRIANEKLFVENYSADVFTLNNKEYYISKMEATDGGYAVKSRSATRNPNVIFSVKKNKNYTGLTEDEFKQLLV